MSRLLRLAAGAAAVALGASGCGSAAPPRTPAEIAAEASFLGTGAPVVVPTVVPTSAPSVPIAMVAVGDAYTTGTASGGFGAKNWAALVAAHFDWALSTVAAPGAGFLERGSGPGTFVDRVPDVVGHHPQVVLVWGARNDVGLSTSRLATAISTFVAHVKAALPHAQVVLIGPSWTDKTPPSAYQTSDAAEKAAAAAAKVAYVDDLSEDWLGGKGLVDSDGIHPTDAGDAAIASHLIADLEVLGVPGAATSAATAPSSSATPSSR